MRPATTRVPEAIDALIALIHDATGIQVTDGAYIGELADEALCVGLTEGPNRPGYTVSVRRQEGLGRPRVREEITVRCLLSLVTGENDTKTLRDRAGTLLGKIAEALADNARRPDVWDSAFLGANLEWIPVLGPSGATLAVLFEVDGTSLL